MIRYTVKKLADLSGVSVRTLHHYDKIGLLKPSTRTEAGYRVYGEQELLRLQQILFYKELDFELLDIARVLDDPDFDLITALNVHKDALKAKQDHIDTLVSTIDKTIKHLQKGDIMLKPEELYEGLDNKTIEQYRNEAREKYGEAVVEQSERSLGKMGKHNFNQLKTEMDQCWKALFAMRHKSPDSPDVQDLIADFYIIIRKFWGTHGQADPQADGFAGLGQMYINDERFTMMDGKAQPEFAAFLKKAMEHYANTSLK